MAANGLPLYYRSTAGLQRCLHIIRPWALTPTTTSQSRQRHHKLRLNWPDVQNMEILFNLLRLNELSKRETQSLKKRPKPGSAVPATVIGQSFPFPALPHGQALPRHQSQREKCKVIRTITRCQIRVGAVFWVFSFQLHGVVVPSASASRPIKLRSDPRRLFLSLGFL